MTGTEGFLGHTPLESEANNFERNKKDAFLVKSRNLGNITSIKIGHDNAGLGSAWHLAQVCIPAKKTAMLSSFSPGDGFRWRQVPDRVYFLQVDVFDPVKGESFVFPFHGWLKPEGKGAKAKDSCKTVIQCGQLPAGAADVLYKVSVQTSDLRGAGTDANVSCTILGDKGDTGPLQLESSANDFERGHTDAFFVKAADVGSMQALQACLPLPDYAVQGSDCG